MRLLFSTILCLLLLPLASSAADLGITPVAVNLNAASTRTTVSVVNYGRESVTMQASAIGWSRVDGVDHDMATNDLVVNPAVFTIEPGQTQIVRVGLKKAPSAEAEATYRLVLRELPTAVAVPASSDGSSSVRVLVAMRVPVYVAPREVVHKQDWQAQAEGSRKVRASIKNVGNVHYKIGKINLRASRSAETPPEASSTVGAVLFPGEERSIDLSLQGPIASNDLVLEVFTDRGVQYVPLVLSRN